MHTDFLGVDGDSLPHGPRSNMKCENNNNSLFFFTWDTASLYRQLHSTDRCKERDTNEFWGTLWSTDQGSSPPTVFFKQSDGRMWYQNCPPSHLSFENSTKNLNKTENICCEIRCHICVQKTSLISCVSSRGGFPFWKWHLCHSCLLLRSHGWNVLEMQHIVVHHSALLPVWFKIVEARTSVMALADKWRNLYS